MSDLWSVTVPGYTTGGATVLLVIVTAAVIWNDRNKDANRERQEALRDARKVFGLAELGHTPSIYTDKPGTDVEVLTVVNASADPIFDVTADRQPIRATQPFWQHADHQGSIRFMLPGRRESIDGEWHVFQGTDPARTVSLQYPAFELDDFARRDKRISVTWTDGRGLSWSREGYADPVRVEV